MANMSNCERESVRKPPNEGTLSADTTSRLNLLEIYGKQDINSPNQPCEKSAYKNCTEIGADEIYKYSDSNTQVRINGKNKQCGDVIEFHTAPNGQKWEEATLVTNGVSKDYSKPEGGKWGEVTSDKPPDAAKDKPINNGRYDHPT
jgi:hypothetical protein